MKDYHTELWLQDKFECRNCKEVKHIDVKIKTAYGEVLCPECSRLCDGCNTWHLRSNLQYNGDDSLVCPECRDYYFEEIAENLKPCAK